MLVQRRIELPPQSIEIVGVMPQGFEFPRGADVWLPAAPLLRAAARPDPSDPAAIAWYLNHYKVFYGIGRLRDATTTVAAQQELSIILSQVQHDSPSGRPGDAVVTAIDDYLIGPTKALCAPIMQQRRWSAPVSLSTAGSPNCDSTGVGGIPRSADSAIAHREWVGLVLWRVRDVRRRMAGHSRLCAHSTRGRSPSGCGERWTPVGLSHLGSERRCIRASV
jgi:hypothetical protein